MFNSVKRWFKRPKHSSGNVYYVRLKTPQGKFYKLGYTSKATLAERMAYGDCGDEKLIDRELFFTFRKDAWDVEQTLLEHFDAHRAFGKYSNNPSMPLSGRGQSELFAYDILRLDEDLNKLSDEEQRAIQHDLEQANSGCLMVLLGLALVPFTFGLSLLLIFGGASGMLSSGSGSHHAARQKPFPPAIKELIDALSQRSGASGSAA